MRGMPQLTWVIAVCLPQYAHIEAQDNNAPVSRVCVPNWLTRDIAFL
jgi:hypothetical protein